MKVGMEESDKRVARGETFLDFGLPLGGGLDIIVRDERRDTKSSKLLLQFSCESSMNGKMRNEYFKCPFLPKGWM